MKSRTRTQEMKYLQALGYAWGRKDGPNTPVLDIVTDSGAFATFYSVQEEMSVTGHHMTIQDAYNYFRALSTEEQKAYGKEWMRMAWSPYDEYHPHTAH